MAVAITSTLTQNDTIDGGLAALSQAVIRAAETLPGAVDRRALELASAPHSAAELPRTGSNASVTARVSS